jgi:hypothetical protein
MEGRRSSGLASQSWVARMRVFVLVAATAMIGVGSLVTIKTLLLQQSGSMIVAVRTLTDHASQFGLSTRNPIRAASDEVTARRLSDPNAFNVPTSLPIVVDEPLKAQAARLGHLRGRREFPTPTAGRGLACFIAVALAPGGDAQSPSFPRLAHCGLPIEAL